MKLRLPVGGVPTLLVLLALTACGGGGSSTPTDPGVSPPPGTSTTEILVEVAQGEDVAEVVAEAGGVLLGPVPGTSYWRVAVPSGTTPEAFARRLGDDARVVGADLDLGMRAPEGDGSTLPAGGLLLADFIPVQDEVLRIGTVAAQSRASGAGVLVALIDSGLVPHPFVDANVEPGGWDYVDEDPDPTDLPNFRDDDGDGHVDEGYGHGLFVASLVLAVAPNARLLPFRVLDSDGVGQASRIAAAVGHAVEMGAAVINLSISAETRVKVLEEAVANARKQGVLVVASAGNTGLDDVNFPAAISDAVSVTSVGPDDVKATFASYGSEVDVSAPGIDLLGAYPSESGTARWSGTSFSAALVSGAFALLRELEPAASDGALVQRLEKACVPIDALNPTTEGKLGEGRLDVDAATSSAP